MDTTILTAVVQAIVQIVTIVGTIWGLFNKQQKDLDTKMNKRMDRLETKFAMRSSIYTPPPPIPPIQDRIKNND